ncbi:YfkD famly protein [Pseudalkalibacillus caeni]|uniref:YfkD-like protein n=1 Tax=Exobacillus caeni TaxID=2574798 RepID=A0A5R9F7H4_9BACL|nr:YfkD famly protein [Pseudalkalibacillus caeni]TLS35725.1 hypothetical protein FCL54_18890 [Pseudalkalibacillus caeni]
MNKFILMLTVALLMFTPIQSLASEGKEKKQAPKTEQKAPEKKAEPVKIPNSAVNISKENTYPNPAQNLPTLQPSELTKELIESSGIEIENPDLIAKLNESNISPSKLAIGYRASIYLGKWPLSYESNETSVNWEYQQANQNKADNRGGKAPVQMRYSQEQEKKITGGLTAKVPESEAVKKMMMVEASEKTQLSLSFQTIIGRGTKKSHVYNVAPKHYAVLTSYVPAVNEKGKVTYGEVYLNLRGSRKSLEVKNITQQGIGAWIPVQDYITHQFNTMQ